MPLQAVGILNVTYGDLAVENGMAYSADQVAARPTRELMFSSRCYFWWRTMATSAFVGGNIISGCTLLIFVLHAFRSAVTAIPAEGASVSGSYTVMLADFSAIGNPDPEGEYRHYLANGVQISSVVSDCCLTCCFLH